MTISLILGGVKSGKSRLAEQLASDSGHPVCYIATATASDEEMQQRITEHKKRRPDDWQTIETPIRLASALEKQCQSNHSVVIDCLTLWLNNLLLANDEQQLHQELEAFINLLPHLSGQLIIVSNETNMGIIPVGELTRQYCDHIGVLHQRIAAIADCVILTVAGLPHILKGQLS